MTKKGKTIILSIKPEFANKIFEGTKKYEFRRSIFKQPDVNTVIVYVTNPTQKIIGEFKIERVLCLAPRELWKKTKKYSGITKDSFFEYFINKDLGYALKIKNTRKYKKPLCIRKDFNSIPPQSFRYVA